MLAFTRYLICMTFTHCLICIHIESATEEVVYEVIAEPQEQTEPAPQAFRDDPAQGPVDTSSEQQPAGKPGAHPFISNYDTYIFLLLVH